MPVHRLNARPLYVNCRVERQVAMRSARDEINDWLEGPGVMVIAVVGIALAITLFYMGFVR